MIEGPSHKKGYQTGNNTAGLVISFRGTIYWVCEYVPNGISINVKKIS